MSKLANNALPYAISFIAGLAICLFITVTSGRKEAWDAPAYFTIGIPMMCLVIFAMIVSRIAKKMAPPAESEP